jgi:hypothetical protein
MKAGKQLKTRKQLARRRDVRRARPTAVDRLRAICLGLPDTDPERFFRPPYVGQRGWVGVRIDRRPDWAAIGTLVRQAYGLIASRR